jgi:hypothetical protein
LTSIPTNLNLNLNLKIVPNPGPAHTMPFRSLYTLDGQGHDFSTSYAKKYTAKTLPIAIPTQRPAFTRCAYSMDAKGNELSYPKEYSSESTTPTLSRNNSEAVVGQVGDDGEWRAVYDLGQRVYVHHDGREAGTKA